VDINSVFSVLTVYIKGCVRGETCQNILKELRSKYFILCANKSGSNKEKRGARYSKVAAVSSFNNTAAHTGDGERLCIGRS